MNGESEMRLVELSTGKVLRRKKLDVRDFGEGMVRVKDRCWLMINGHSIMAL